MKKILISSLLALSFYQSSIDAFCHTYCHNPQDPFFKFGYYKGQYLSIDQDYGKFGVVMPLSLSSMWDVVLDAQAITFFDQKWGANAGFAVRKGCGDNAVGVNFFLDFLSANYRRSFQQVGVGIDWLHSTWDFRINGYFPFNDNSKETTLCTFDDYTDGYLAKILNIQYAYSGFDAEIGMPFYIPFLTCYCLDLEFYGAAGPYYYFKSSCDKFWGAYGRIKACWKSFASLELKLSADKVHHTHLQAVLQVDIPFEFLNLVSSRKVQQISRPVHRNEVIVLNHYCTWFWNW